MSLFLPYTHMRNDNSIDMSSVHLLSKLKSRGTLQKAPVVMKQYQTVSMMYLSNVGIFPGIAELSWQPQIDFKSALHRNGFTSLRAVELKSSVGDPVIC